MAMNREIEEDEEGESWITSYSDLMTDLLAIFVILFSFAMASTMYANAAEAKKEAEAAEATDSQSNPDQAIDNILDPSDSLITYPSGNYTETVASEFDRIYELIKDKIDTDGYSDSIFLTRTEGSLTFRFNESVLFYGNSEELRETSYDILSYMGDVLSEVDKYVIYYEIEGHTAKVSGNNSSELHWRLSSGRAITVLTYFVDKCGLDESKMKAIGSSYYDAVASNDSEDGKAQNRRVEVKIVYQN